MTVRIFEFRLPCQADLVAARQVRWQTGSEFDVGGPGSRPVASPRCAKYSALRAEPRNFEAEPPAKKKKKNEKIY